MNQFDLADAQGGVQETYDSLLDNLTKAISFSGTMLMALDPWQNPTCLTRIWCLYEVYISYTFGCKVIMAMCTEAKVEFVDHLRTNEAAIDDIVGRIDAESAQAGRESDRLLVMTHIAKVGIEEFNAFVRGKLSDALSLSAMAVVTGVEL